MHQTSICICSLASKEALTDLGAGMPVTHEYDKISSDVDDLLSSAVTIATSCFPVVYGLPYKIAKTHMPFMPSTTAKTYKQHVQIAKTCRVVCKLYFWCQHADMPHAEFACDSHLFGEHQKIKMITCSTAVQMVTKRSAAPDR